MDNLRGKDLTTALLSSGEFAVAALKACGIEEPGEKFVSPYNPHEEDPSAYLRQTTDGRYGIWYWRLEGEESKGYWLTISQLYRDYVAGLIEDIRRGRDEPRRRKIGKAESAVWLIRLAAEIGFVTLPEITWPPIDRDAPPGAARVYQGAVLLCKCRMRYDVANDTFPAASRFMADWTGLPDTEVGRGKRWLVSHGFLVVVQAGQPYRKGKVAIASQYRLVMVEEVSRQERKRECQEAAREPAEGKPSENQTPDREEGNPPPGYVFTYLPEPPKGTAFEKIVFAAEKISERRRVRAEQETNWDREGQRRLELARRMKDGEL